MDVAELVKDLIERELLLGATLSKPRRADPAGPRKVTVEPVVVAGELRYRWRRLAATRSSDENLAPDETETQLLHLIGGEFRQAHLHAVDADHQILAGGAAATVLRRAPTRRQAPPVHDRRKRRLLEGGEPVPFLVELGVMTRDGTVRSARQAKFRQVSRFLELVEDVLPALSSGPLRIVDFGSGKSYLTFALHHLLTAVHGRDVEIVGLDLKEDVVETCTALAMRLGAVGLRFEVGDIGGYAGSAPDLVVSLHACDTATDAALERAVRWEAPVILAVPCCQHELASQLRSTALSPLLSRGLLRHRFAADVTDAVRAQLLEAVGYDVQLLEFVELEHTPKNVLIRAVRRPRRNRDKAYRAYLDFKSELGIEPTLERLLADLLPAG
jgi:methyltransferase family protein